MERVVVLVGTEGPENLGAIARAMMNMGAENLVLVDPRCDVICTQSIQYALHARPILEKAVVFRTLEEALEGCDLAVAVSRRTGQWRQRDFVLRDMVKRLSERKEGKLCLVFGRETSGLTNEEVKQCDWVVSIPSSDAFASLNLAQAVMVVLYEFYQSGEGGLKKREVAQRKSFEAMISEWTGFLRDGNYFKLVPEWRIRNYIKKIMLRAELDESEAGALQSLFFRMRGLLKNNNKNFLKKD